MYENRGSCSIAEWEELGRRGPKEDSKNRDGPKCSPVGVNELASGLKPFPDKRDNTFTLGSKQTWLVLETLSLEWAIFKFPKENYPKP